jgi:hypothetical protein
VAFVRKSDLSGTTIRRILVDAGRAPA